MEIEEHHEQPYDSESDESDNEDISANNNIGTRDSNALLDTWLAELDSLSTDLESRPADPFRFSQATLEDTQEDELNAILGELSALQMSLDQEIKQQPTTLLQVPPAQPDRKTLNVSNGGGSDNGVRTESPDNDSGFSDNASLLSSGSSLSASGSSSGSSTTSNCNPKNIPPSTVIHANELAAFVTAKLESDQNAISDEKAEKIREALAKMRAASVTRLYVKAFSPDGSSKALMVEESMSCGRVLALLADKNHVPLSHKWALVEHIPHLHMERIYEDHENMVENLMMWTRDSKNKIYFVERDVKYDMFVNPQRYFLETRVTHGGPMDDHTKNSLIEEFFTQCVGVPEVESVLFLKAEGKKAWKKFPFVLRASGIYYYPKGRAHVNSSKDLVCLAPIDPNQQAYEGIGWKKKFKAPTEFGFALKPSRLQVKSHRHMKYLCTEDAETLRLWMVGLRIAKYGKRLWDNYRTLMEDLAHEDLDRFGRSVSLASMPLQISTNNIMSMEVGEKSSLRQFSNPTPQVPTNRINDSIEHSMFTTAPSPSPAQLSREEGFESDAPVGGTIKRKPSSTVLNPKIPLTINTRSIVGDYINIGAHMNSDASHNSNLTHTLQRKRSSSGNSSNSSSSSSTLHQVQITSPLPSNQRLLGNNKPPLGVSRMPAPVFEESSVFDYEDLPPPPPELLMEDHEVPPSPDIEQIEFCPPPPVPPPAPSFVPQLPMQPKTILATKSGGSTSSLNNSKKGVSFANELTQRLMHRNNGLSNGSQGVHGETSQSINENNLSSSHPSSPKKMEDPPPDFLTDLQRVMEKKWQVAQKCNVENTTPHEILGFRFEPTAMTTTEKSMTDSGTPTNLNNVRAWVSQHYGTNADDLPPLQNNKILQQTSQSNSLPRNSPPHLIFQNQNQRSLPRNPAISHLIPPTLPKPNLQINNLPQVIIYENFQGANKSQINNISQQIIRNKKPPPPIPKRAESTHLSANIVFN